MFRILICTLLFFNHPVHVSFLSIDYAEKSRTFSVFLKLYNDDFLLDAGLKPTDTMIQDSLKNDRYFRDLILKYTNEKVKIAVNDELFPFELNDYDLSENELKVHLSFPAGKKISTVTIQNLVMTQLYSDQVNMVIVKVSDFEEGIRLTSDKTERTFQISKFR